MPPTDLRSRGAVLQIVEPGFSVLTDLGRRRGVRFGLPVNGALDQFSARVANILVGNAESEALVEVTDTRFVATVSADVLAAVAGADADVTVDGFPQPHRQPFPICAGQSVVIDGIRDGMRVYLGVHGGFATPELLGSRAPDLLVGFQGLLTAGAELSLARSSAPVYNPYFAASLFDFALKRVPIAGPGVIPVLSGPEYGEFAHAASLLFSEGYTIQPRSNHIGLRLAGRVPRREAKGEILSRGVPIGAVEAPSAEELLILHRGRGITAGYPVIAVATTAALDVLAQARPGDRVRFAETTVEEALAVLRAQRQALDRLCAHVGAAFAALGRHDLRRHDLRLASDIKEGTA